MLAHHKLAEQVEHYKTNVNGGHFTLKPTISVNNPLQKQLTHEGWAFLYCHVADLADFSGSSEG